jgi:hypothetical protein
VTEHPRHVSFETGSVVVDATALAGALQLDESLLRELMRTGRLGTVCEAGIEDDAGMWRLTFRLPDRRLRLIVDATGQILRRSLVKFGEVRRARERLRQGE